MNRLIPRLNVLTTRSLAIQLLLLTGWLGVGCEEEEKDLENIPVSFGFSISEQTGGRIKDLPEDIVLRFSLETNTGLLVFKNRDMLITEVGGRYMTDVVELKAGGYRITDFMLVQHSKVLYATPKNGSKLGQFVNHALPYTFSVSKNSPPNVNLEVVDVTQSDAVDFGYTSFGVAIRNVFQIAVFTWENGVRELISAKASIKKGDVTLEEFDLAARANTISYTGDPDETFTLIVHKDGYAPHQRDFNFNFLKNEMANAPLKVDIYPAGITFSTSVPPLDEYPNGYPFKIYIGGTGGAINAEWSDGAAETYELTLYETDVTHTFQSEGSHTVYITGDIDSITYFYSYYGDGVLDNVDFSGAKNLDQIQIGMTNGPAFIDLTHNAKLRNVELGIHNLEEVLLPASHNIRSIDFTGSGLGAEALDEIIENIYSNATSKNFTGGFFSLWINPYEEDNSLNNMVGPPSDAGLTKLMVLRNDYGWQIGPDIWE